MPTVYRSGVVDDELYFVTDCAITQVFRDRLYEAVAHEKTLLLFSLSSQEKMFYLFTATSTAVTKLAWYIFECLEYRKLHTVIVITV